MIYEMEEGCNIPTCRYTKPFYRLYCFDHYQMLLLFFKNKNKYLAAKISLTFPVLFVITLKNVAGK